MLNQVAVWLRNGTPCWLSTVVATYGSSPRPVGSLMACTMSQKLVGSLSGGCVEEDLLKKISNGSLAQESFEFIRYGETAEEAEKLGLPCGGHLDLVVEKITPKTDIIQHFTDISKHMQQRKAIRRIVRLNTSQHSLMDPTDSLPLKYDSDQQVLEQTYGPSYRMYIVGTNMVSEYVARLALALDYQVTVIDTNSQKLYEFNVDNVKKICDMPDDVLMEGAIDEYCAIVALSHDPRLDDIALIAALDSNAFYIGAMGSIRTSVKRMQRLCELDVSEASLEKLHAPIGMDIGSKTPPEIAVSIMAEVTRVKNRQSELNTS